MPVKNGKVNGRTEQHWQNFTVITEQMPFWYLISQTLMKNMIRILVF